MFCLVLFVSVLNKNPGLVFPCLAVRLGPYVEEAGASRAADDDDDARSGGRSGIARGLGLNVDDDARSGSDVFFKALLRREGLVDRSSSLSSSKSLPNVRLTFIEDRPINLS